tara:strand:+ start:1151 stop:1894 length:744 start_codon:yes stop_codon:yes gene_type:complete
MSTPFKMKGWSGYQKPSALKQDGLFERVTGKKFEDTKLGKTQIGQDITEAGRQIKKDFGKGGKVYAEIKSDIDKLKKELGLKSKDIEDNIEDSNDNNTSESGSDSDSDVVVLSSSSSTNAKGTIVKPNDKIPDVDGFVSGSGSDPWKYKKIDGGYQTKKGPNGDTITITDPNSEAYKKIGEKIFDVDPVDPIDPVEKTKKEHSEQDKSTGRVPWQVLNHWPNLTYKAYLGYQKHYDRTAKINEYAEN